MTRAAVIVGEVVHERLRPVAHKFTYPLFCLRIPLTNLDALSQHMAINRRGWMSFHERDHGPRDGSSCLDWIRRVLQENGVAASLADVAEVELHTFPRMLGYVFNPVSFWVCRRADDAVIAVLVEVNNTFGESHSYLLTPPTGDAIRSGEPLHAVKELHVSPFNEVRGSYRFCFHFGTERWLARIDYGDAAISAANDAAFDSAVDRHSTLLHTHISGATHPLTRSELRRAALRFPLQALAVTARIHWQALRLIIKRVPFFGKLQSHMTGISRT